MTWTQTPAQWSNFFFENLFKYEWVQTRSPAGAIQWEAKDGPDIIPDAHNPEKKHKPTMLTTDLSRASTRSTRRSRAASSRTRRPLPRPSPARGSSSPTAILARARANLGPEVPREVLLWQDPVPAVDHPLIDDADAAALKAKVLASGLTVSELVGTAWPPPPPSAAETTRRCQWRAHPPRPAEGLGGEPARAARQGAEGAHPHPGRVQPQRQRRQEGVAGRRHRARRNAGVEEAAKAAGHDVSVPFAPGRTDASQAETTRIPSSGSSRRPWLPQLSEGRPRRARRSALIDKAQLLTLTAPELTVLIGGLRAININVDGAKHGVFTDKPGALTTDFFTNLLDMSTQWKAAGESKDVYEGRDRQTGELKWTGTRVDLVFGSNSILRALAESMRPPTPRTSS